MKAAASSSPSMAADRCTVGKALMTELPRLPSTDRPAPAAQRRLQFADLDHVPGRADQYGDRAQATSRRTPPDGEPAHGRARRVGGAGAGVGRLILGRHQGSPCRSGRSTRRSDIVVRGRWNWRKRWRGSGADYRGTVRRVTGRCVTELRDPPRAAVSPARDGIGSKLKRPDVPTWGCSVSNTPPDASGRTGPRDACGC